MQQNVLKRHQHNEELALGIAKGPVSTLYRWVMITGSQQSYYHTL